MKPRSRRAIFNANVARVALEIGRKENDGMYIKYAKFKKLYRLYKAQLIKKYTPRAASEVRRKLSKR